MGTAIARRGAPLLAVTTLRFASPSPGRAHACARSRGVRSNLRASLPLGVVFFIGMTFAVGATALIDGGALIAWVSGAEEPSDELLQSGRLQLAMLFGIACALPTLLALWFAPALVVFHDAGAMPALATSLRASRAN